MEGDLEVEGDCWRKGCAALDRDAFFYFLLEPTAAFSSSPIDNLHDGKHQCRRFKCDAHFKFFFCCECFLFGSLRMDVEVAMHAQMSMLMLLETPLASSERHLKPLLMSLRLIGFSFSRFLLQ